MTPLRGSVRQAVRVNRDPDAVWALVGDPERLPEWFPGISSVTVDGETRTVLTGSGIPLPEQLVTIDPLLRRFQYRITAPFFREHLSTIDVHDLGDGSSLLVYGVDSEPSIMALVIGGAAGAALEVARDLLEDPVSGHVGSQY